MNTAFDYIPTVLETWGCEVWRIAKESSIIFSHIFIYCICDMHLSVLDVCKHWSK